MKKLTYLLFILIFFGSCKFNDKPYSYDREFDGGTFITPEGIVKYISGTPDTATVIRDNYAVIETEITYIKKVGDNNADSILAWGHCYSESANPYACPPDSTITFARLKKYSAVKTHNGIGVAPTGFATTDDLNSGVFIESVLPLKYETDYYIKSYVVTGHFESGEPVYEHIAYNQNELKITTISPEDRWVGPDDPSGQGAPDFLGGICRGALSFTYDGYMFVGFGRTEAPLTNTATLYRFDPEASPEEAWTRPYKDLVFSSAADNFSEGVAFVIEDVQTLVGTYHDCVFIGTGRKEDGYATKEFYRLDLEANLSAPDGEKGEWAHITSGTLNQDFPGSKRYNAVAFSINGIGYVGLGTSDNPTHEPFKDFFKYDPSDHSDGYQYGKWTPIGNFDGGYRTGVAVFQIGEYVYMGLGKDLDGNLKNDFWRINQTTGDYLDYVQRESFPGDPRSEAVGFSLGENGYMGTGWGGDSARSDFWRYSPFNDSWDRKRVYMGEPRYEAVGQGIVIGDNVFKGYLGTGWNGTDYFDDFWHYRP